MEENTELMHDDNEKNAMYAIMNAAAYRGKGKKGQLPSVSDLYKRPSEKQEVKTEQDIREMQEHTKDWLSQFDLDSIDRKAKKKEVDE